MIQLCVHRRTLGAHIAAAAGGLAEVAVVADISVDPRHRDEIDAPVADTFPAGLLGRCLPAAEVRELSRYGSGSRPPSPGRVLARGRAVTPEKQC
jgi:hypothetical protein